MQSIIETAHKVAEIIPYTQYAVTIEHIEAFAEALERLLTQLENCPKLGDTDGMEEHSAVFHYFYGRTDMYICEYDGEDEMYGFSIISGDLYNAGWGYISRAEIISIEVLNIDYYFDEQSIEAALYKQYPRQFKKPQSLQQ
jgi:hypothetical protein